MYTFQYKLMWIQIFLLNHHFTKNNIKLIAKLNQGHVTMCF